MKDVFHSIWRHTVGLGGACFLFGTLAAVAHEGAPPMSLQRPVQAVAVIPQFVLPPTDVEAELAMDRNRAVPTPVRFAVAQPVQVTPATDGAWEELPDGRLWRFRVLSAGATDLNLGFTAFWLPQGATLHIIAESEAYYQGPYTEQDNQPYEQLWTPVVPGEAAVIELFVPAQANAEPRLVLGQVGAGYRDWFHRKGLTEAKVEGTCNIDVVCPQGAPWTNEIRSVAVYSVSGSFACTGTLINDAATDLRSYFLTANHCEVTSANAASVVVYWNYQSAACGKHGPGSLAQNQSGAIFRAAKTEVDFSLLELVAVPNPSFQVYYSGWDRSGTAPAGGVGIHHPDCDVKAMSFASKTLTTENSCIGTGGVNTHWKVTWDAGVTEPGSSGSGIWNLANHALVGTLSGGDSACSTPTAPDCYGKFSIAWASGTSASSRLRDWLDPQNTGVTSITGVDPRDVTAIAAAGSALLAESAVPTNGVIDPGETVTLSFSLKNVGGLNATNLVATLLATNGVSPLGSPQTYGSLAGGGLAASRVFAFTVDGTCGGTISPVLQLQDGARNLGTVSFSFTLGVPSQTTVYSENFDGVAAPSLPAGWTVSQTGTSPWATTTAAKDTLPNSVFASDPSTASDNVLTSPSLPLTNALLQLSFRHNYTMETSYDGGVLEISLQGGAFLDILSAGGSFGTNGYNGTISSSYSNPLAGRFAWTGNSSGFITTTVNLPPAVASGNVRLRWRFGSDDSESAKGWYVDTVSIYAIQYRCCTIAPLLTNAVLLSGNRVMFSYATVSGQTYVLETATELNPGAWMPLQTNAGNGLVLAYSNTVGDSNQRFFRMRTE